MSQTVYTNYWVNQRSDVRKEHGSYLSEEDAVKGIKAWWEIHREKYRNVEYNRTNTGALEIIYDDDNYFYRVEKRNINWELPSRSYRLKTKGEIEAKRKQLNLDDETLLFDELPEPYRDRLIVAMADASKAQEYVYNNSGQPTVKIKDL